MKRIVVCCDGTWNKPGNTDRGQPVETNVQKIYDAIASKTTPTTQVKYYGQGVGTGYSVTDQLLGGGMGAGIDHHIQDAYKFLMWSYQPGDEIYLFGFSRGAYTVRSLAGLIRNCTIIKPEYLHLVGEAYHLYRDRSPITHPDSDLMKAFKNSYGIEQEIPIKFLGVWDTVGALGIPLPWFNWWNKKYLFHDVKLSSQIKYAYHALAVDEQRKSFTPTLWETSATGSNGANQVAEQVWFSGTHSNIGGGYEDSGLSNITLKWMIDKAKDTGLEFDDSYVNALLADSSGELRGTNTLLYMLLGVFWRSINDSFSYSKKKQAGALSVVPNRNERIHYTCLERSHKIKTYKPKNVPPAVSKGTDFDPAKDSWLPDWKEYLAM
jgi:uncharacterized protein (DUF2235 family)